MNFKNDKCCTNKFACKSLILNHHILTFTYLFIIIFVSCYLFYFINLSEKYSDWAYLSFEIVPEKFYSLKYRLVECVYCMKFLYNKYYSFIKNNFVSIM